MTTARRSRVRSRWGSVGPWLRSRALRRATLRSDLLAGLPVAVSSVPDGMAAGVLAGVIPVAGLYASFAGPVAGGLASSTRRMVITTTSAAALAAGSALGSVDQAERADALVLLTLLAGGFMLLAGLLRLGRYARFVSHSVMIGFLTGIAVNIVCGQLADLTGSPSRGSTNVAKALHILVHPGQVHLPSLLVGIGAIAALVGVARTRLAVISTLVALIVPTAVVLVAGVEIARVDDAGPIPSGFPSLAWPRLGLLDGTLIGSAMAIAAIVLVQGAGVAESAPNGDGPARTNQDFVAQGVGNVASALFRGLPVGGSVGTTALNVSAGGRSRWSVIFAGIWVLIILVAFAPAVGVVAMPTLAAVLVVAATASIRPGEMTTIWRAGPNSRIALVSTFVATLLLPVPAAVGLGVVVSLLLQLNQEAIDLAVVELVPSGGRIAERPAPALARSDGVTVLAVYGSLFYAGARTLQSQLPDPSGTRHAAVVLRLRGRTTLGATFFLVVAAYARQLAEGGGRLYLSGLSSEINEGLRSGRGLATAGSVHLFPATELVGDSTRAAIVDAEAWLVTASDEEA
ncbi:SulP family inorganic anion transporter [Desertimonas flava]|uniref:SulP family inorganic anion transporter n=1 Tax=Desertimonas flava TaxID=2064846 RepID=UPI003B83432F